MVFGDGGDHSSAKLDGIKANVLDASRKEKRSFKIGSSKQKGSRGHARARARMPGSLFNPTIQTPAKISQLMQGISARQSTRSIQEPSHRSSIRWNWNGQNVGYISQSGDFQSQLFEALLEFHFFTREIAKKYTAVNFLDQKFTNKQRHAHWDWSNPKTIWDRQQDVEGDIHSYTPEHTMIISQFYAEYWYYETLRLPRTRYQLPST
ncbi:hypothetical protein PsorP6_014570 [Peronosclerospora sorghi]|uniref:Uncharacterized protein n=1 Tax=Peronosclerospora sorghi TaxID=230839 RepID=A0ACC0VQS0_9STRA|nr:hypothetical protein PsorP6_014570 [Peronosclerospora sorghi]